MHLLLIQHNISESFHSPIVRVLLGAIGIALAYVFYKEVRKIPAKLFTLMITAFIDMVGLLMIIPLLPFYVKELSGDGLTILHFHMGVGTITGFIVTSYTVAQLLSAPLWGKFSDRVGRRPTLLIALGASGIAYLIFGFANSLLLLFLSRLVQGAGGGTVGVIQAYVADSTEPKDRTRALGWLSATTNLGVVIGPVIGSFAVALGTSKTLSAQSTISIGRAAPGVLAAALCFINILFAARYLTESRSSDHASSGENNEPTRKSRQAVWGVISHSGEPASRLILIYAISIGAFQGTFAVLALFLNVRFQVTAQMIGYFFMYTGAISVFTRVLLLGRMVDWLGEAKLSRLGLILLAAGVIGMPLSGNLGTLALAVALIPLGTAFTFPCVTALLSRVVSQRERGLYMGMQQTYGGITRAIAPVLYGRAFDTLGVASPYYFSSAIIAATIFLGFGLDKYARHEPAASSPKQPEVKEADELPEMAMAAGASSSVEPETN
ncbi:MAG TPA: MFS transporter [Pyrinomonadaceae bacterium]|jgi:MFS family permease|nr:MFS transporter [Pyrinomonadaceae bacterium]